VFGGWKLKFCNSLHASHCATMLVFVLFILCCLYSQHKSNSNICEKDYCEYMQLTPNLVAVESTVVIICRTNFRGRAICISLSLNSPRYDFSSSTLFCHCTFFCWCKKFKLVCSSKWQNCWEERRKEKFFLSCTLHFALCADAKADECEQISLWRKSLSN